MKNILVCSLVVALCSVGFAGGELPGARSYNPVPAPAPAPIYQPQYVVPAPVTVNTNPTILQRTGGFVRNVFSDVVDVGRETVDLAVGVVTLNAYDVSCDDVPICE